MMMMMMNSRNCEHSRQRPAFSAKRDLRSTPVHGTKHSRRTRSRGGRGRSGGEGRGVLTNKRARTHSTAISRFGWEQHETISLGRACQSCPVRGTLVRHNK